VTVAQLRFGPKRSSGHPWSARVTAWRPNRGQQTSEHGRLDDFSLLKLGKITKKALIGPQEMPSIVREYLPDGSGKIPEPLVIGLAEVLILRE
jgi:hypothetical protein